MVSVFGVCSLEWTRVSLSGRTKPVWGRRLRGNDDISSASTSRINSRLTLLSPGIGGLVPDHKMSGFKGIVQNGWHPKGRDGKKESWRNDFKGVNQVVSTPNLHKTLL